MHFVGLTAKKHHIVIHYGDRNCQLRSYPLIDAIMAPKPPISLTIPRHFSGTFGNSQASEKVFELYAIIYG